MDCAFIFTICSDQPWDDKSNLCVDRCFRFSSGNTKYKVGKDMTTCHVNSVGLIPDKGLREYCMLDHFKWGLIES